MAQKQRSVKDSFDLINIFLNQFDLYDIIRIEYVQAQNFKVTKG